ncbi:hypothetical protein BSG1_14508 [Bacillus sp. SG-1]|nr:hypothetical protein BSG1_14508 [Bacillus sp. SG-1]
MNLMKSAADANVETSCLNRLLKTVCYTESAESAEKQK